MVRAKGPHTLFDDRTGGHPVSRDWALPDIPCKAVACVCNCNGKCTMPTCIEIGPSGVCEMWVKSKLDDMRKKD